MNKDDKRGLYEELDMIAKIRARRVEASYLGFGDIVDNLTEDIKHRQERAIAMMRRIST